MARRIQATETSLEIIESLEELQGATMPEISEHLGLANSTIHGHLSTLMDKRLVVKEGNQYHLGLRFFHYGNVTKQRKPEYEFAQEHVEYLASETHEGANFCVEEHGQVIVLNGASSAEDPAYDIGNVFDMHITAVGKAILAEMSDEQVSEIVAQHGLPAHTDDSITDEAELFDELEEISRTGLAFNDGEMLEGLAAVGVAVKRPDSSVLGALSVGGPSYRISDRKLREEFPEIILEAKRRFEEDIESFYHPS
ncbi:IclR family transcriptional regulator [Natronosalvus rutilus]|uniref:IclR family transcriptional regulator n=1 Tax=Natronosalvus rutilus TaxID=2953753 RepID=A0A9E7NCF4_9EURY|nr:IclR family transcriptional regulator [Natronosalvus rutilus]UTF55727.1 IclR family transcriptional regulator [Natronosalvus rutilus]